MFRGGVSSRAVNEPSQFLQCLENAPPTTPAPKLPIVIFVEKRPNLTPV